jgi:hypothetical protein
MPQTAEIEEEAGVLGALWVVLCRVLTCRRTTNDILFNVARVKHFFQQFYKSNKIKLCYPIAYRNKF